MSRVMGRGDNQGPLPANLPQGAMTSSESQPRTAADSVELLREIATACDRAIVRFKRDGLRFDKWPVGEHSGPWTPEQIAALDPEVRWQGGAFSVYTDLAGISGKAQAFLDDYVEAEAAQDSRPLDVERLAQAFHSLHSGGEFRLHAEPHDEEDRATAKMLASRYARLAEKPHD